MVLCANTSLFHPFFQPEHTVYVENKNGLNYNISKHVRVASASSVDSSCAIHVLEYQ